MLTITLHAADYEAVFAPQIGGACVQLKKNGREIFHHIEGGSFEAADAARYGLPLLFPPNRLDGGKYIFEGQEIHYPIKNAELNVSCHGSVHRKAWQVEGYTEEDDFAEIHLVYEGDGEEDQGELYPYEYEIEQVYTLDAQGLHQEVRITNFTEQNMPIGLGFHTAFALHPEHGEKVSVSIGKHIQLSERILPTGVLEDLSEQEAAFASAEGGDGLFRVLDDHYTASPLQINGKPFHGAILTDPVSGTRTCYKVDSFYKNWMIWNCGQEGSFICLEPQNWRINAPNLKCGPEESGMDVLGPQETLSVFADVWQEEI